VRQIARYRVKFSSRLYLSSDVGILETDNDRTGLAQNWHHYFSTSSSLYETLRRNHPIKKSSSNVFWKYKHFTPHSLPLHIFSGQRALVGKYQERKVFTLHAIIYYRYIQGVSEIRVLILTGERTHQSMKLFSITFSKMAKDSQNWFFCQTSRFVWFFLSWEF
jgi:hypothetical protein